MEGVRKAFLALPDTVIITDAYWYILDYNHVGPFGSLRKGAKLMRYMPDCSAPLDDEYRHGGKVYARKTAPVYEQGRHVGYTAYLTDITRRVGLVEELRRKSAELERLTADQARANAYLEDCVRQTEELLAYSEQLRIARSIHDDSGHAITALHTISQMCLQLRSTDPGRCGELLDEGLSICEGIRAGKRRRVPASLGELLDDFERESLFPVETAVRGEEGAFAGGLYAVIADICEEAYHNTLSHSLAERLTIVARAAPDRLLLEISDDGRFRGEFRPGFGLTAMAEKIRATGGTVAFRAREGEGFGITVEWQVAEHG